MNDIIQQLGIKIDMKEYSWNWLHASHYRIKIKGRWRDGYGIRAMSKDDKTVLHTPTGMLTVPQNAKRPLDKAMEMAGEHFLANSK